MTIKTSVHAEASLHRKLVLFAAQLEGYLAHFPGCHKYTLTQGIRQAYLDVYNLTTEAQKRYHKKTTLTLLDVRHARRRPQRPACWRYFSPGPRPAHLLFSTLLDLPERKTP